MPNHPLILAHDLGTTGNKATLFRADGSIVAATVHAYPTDFPHPNWAEQDPTHWRQAVFGSTRQLLAESGADPADIAVVSFSGQMNGALVVDERGTPLRPAIIWADQRADTQTEFIRSTCGEAEVYALTGNRVSATYTAPKVLWIKDNQPDIWRRTHKVLQAKDYAAFLFSGVFATDYSDASLTLLLDIEARRWAVEIVERLGLAPEVLPEIRSSATVVGRVTREAAAESGLSEGTAVVIGGGDGACATVGAGSVSDGDIYNNIGSSSWIALTSERPLLDPDRRMFNLVHLVPDLFIPLGTMQTAGGAFDWLERLLRPGEDAQHAALTEAAATVPSGSRRLLFLPYLMGERSPHWNPLARGAFVGLDMTHGKAEMARAVLEGVAFNLRHILDVLRSQGTEVSEMRLIGGGGRSDLWRQILADIYGLPIARLGLSAEATALGAAIAGGVGVGIHDDYNVAKALSPVTAYDYPKNEAMRQYEAYYEQFKRAYEALEPVFGGLAGLG